MESKLTKLLAPLDRDEQSLMKLDAIFAVSLCDYKEYILKLAFSVAVGEKSMGKGKERNFT